MNAAAHNPLLPRPPEGLAAGAMLALAAHLALLLALAVGLNWRQHDTEVYSAEIWAALPQVAAPKLAEPEPAPAPTPQPEPQPAPAAAVTPPPAPVRSEADIALEKAKLAEEEREKAREAEKKRKAERERALALEREAEAKRQREAEAALLAKQRELQRKRQQELARQAEEERKEAARKAEEKRREAALEKQRQENLKRMLGQAGATGGAEARGDALHDAGPSASYAGKLIARIKPNIVLTERLPASLEAVVEVRAGASGNILSRRIVQSSGNAVWDEAVLRAIDRTASLPRDTDGRVPPAIVISFRPE